MPEKRVVLVTASTRGIGKVIAMRFAQEDAVIALNYLSNQSAADQACAEIRAVSPGSKIFQGDVSSAKEAERLVRDVLKEFGRLDILVNNAGPMLVKPLFDTTPDEWEWMIRSNLSSAFPHLGCGLLHHRRRAPGPRRALDSGIRQHNGYKDMT